MKEIFSTKHPCIVYVITECCIITQNILNIKHTETASVFNMCAQILKFTLLPEIQSTFNFHIGSHHTIIIRMIFSIMIKIDEEESATPFVSFIHLKCRCNVLTFTAKVIHNLKILCLYGKT